MNKKVFLGVGHGGADPGAVANGFNEKDLNLSIALACRAELERHNVQVLMSRTKDENDPLREEIKECNAYKPDICVDIHNNAGGGDGFEAYHYHKGGTSLALARSIEKEVIAIGQNSRGCKTKLMSNGQDYFGFIRETLAPAVLVECAFIDNKKDLEIIDTEAERKVMGIAIAKGVLVVLGIKWIAPVAPIVPPQVKPVAPAPTQSLHRVQVGAFGDKVNAERLAQELKQKGYSTIIV